MSRYAKCVEYGFIPSFKCRLHNMCLILDKHEDDAYVSTKSQKQNQINTTGV